jgi:hypothetical protein
LWPKIWPWRECRRKSCRSCWWRSKSSSTFLSLDSDFFGKKPDSCASTGFLLSWYGPLWLLAVPQNQEAIERNAISDKRGHYGSNDSPAKLHSERGFFGMLPTMAAPLGEVCGVPREYFEDD